MDTDTAKQTAENTARIVCQTNQGLEIISAVTRLTRYQVVFEVYGSQVTLRTAEV